MVYYLLVIVPHFLIFLKFHSFGHNEVPQKPPPAILLLIIWDILVALLWNLYFLKMALQNLSFKETSIKCDYKIGKYLGIIFPGLFLSIITLGIYSPWFISNIQRFFVDNSSYKDKNFSFQGQGGKLFQIITLSIVVPMILIIMIVVSVAKRYGIVLPHQLHFNTIIHQLIFFITLIPYFYLLYKWRINFKYSDYHIKWDTKFWQSIGKILSEIVLSIITFGIYLPLAFLRIYKYFTEKTKSNQIDNQSIQFGYDIDQFNDFKMIWVQILFTIATLGIYFPWAFCKVGQRVLGKTYMEKINV